MPHLLSLPASPKVSYEIKSRLRDYPPAAGRLCGIILCRRSAIPAERLFHRSQLYEIKKHHLFTARDDV